MWYDTSMTGDSSSESEMADPSDVLELPVWVDGTPKWVTGLTKRTTCDDIIYALLYNEGKHDHDCTDRYTIYERWRDVERPLQARTKILKIWRAWGAEQCNVQLTMKHNDEPDYFGEFLHHRRRRHRRSRHRSKPDKNSKSRGDNHVQSTSDRLKTMEQFAKLVINQERKLHEIGHRIEETDRRIDTMETNLHFIRVAENGEDYLQNNYLDNRLEDSMDEFLRNVPSENVDMYIQFCERVLQIDDKIKFESSRIEDLSEQIKESVEPSTYINLSDNLEVELTELQAELNRLVNANVMQKYQATEINKEIEICDKSLEEKQKIVQQLLKELEDDGCNSVHNYQNIEAMPYRPENPHFCKKVTFSDDREAEYVNLGDIIGYGGEDRETEGPSISGKCGNFKGVCFEMIDSQRKTSDLDDSISLDTENASNDSQLGSSPPGVRFASPIVTYSKAFHPDSPISNYINVKSSSPIGSYPEVKNAPHKTSCLRIPRYPEGSGYKNDDLISERIQSEVYKYKRVCQPRLTSPCSYVNAEMQYTCTRSTEDNDSNSDTGLSSMHSDESPSYGFPPQPSIHLETLV